MASRLYQVVFDLEHVKDADVIYLPAGSNGISINLLALNGVSYGSGWSASVRDATGTAVSASFSSSTVAGKASTIVNIKSNIKAGLNMFQVRFSNSNKKQYVFPVYIFGTENICGGN